jgi:glycerol transport system ATP-binding protein
MTVTLDHVTRTVEGVEHIRDVSLTLESGTLNVLLGPTLSGKTSIMRLLAGLDKPTTGKVLVNGKDVTGADVRQRSVAMVYQQFINYPSLTVYENIASPLRVQGKPRGEIEARVAEAAKLLRLEPFLKRTPLQLSGGQQQRLCIARTVAVRPEVILFDEPCSALDPISTAKVEELIQELSENYTIAIVTHNMQQAARVSDKTAFMYLGELIEFDDTSKIFTSPSDRRTQDYITGRFG